MLPSVRTPDPHPDPRVQAIVARFESLRRDNLPLLAALYHPEARFKDPFNTVRGVPAITRIFAHMFDTLDDPRFVILERLTQGNQCFLSWDFHFRTRGRGAAEWCIHGATHLVLDADGRITEHRDYWDAAEELYEKLPLLGALMRWLRRRLAA